MIHSMTAFARESLSTDQGNLSVELRSVNHRYLDCSFKMPESLRVLEADFRDRTSKQLNRGKFDCMIRLQFQSGTGTNGPLDIDDQKLHEVIALTNAISGKITRPQALNPLEILQFPGVCITPDGTEKALQEAAITLFDSALQSLLENRAREGQKLATLINERLVQVAQTVADTRNNLPALLLLQRERIISRIEELDVDIDQGRLEQELVYMVQKADIDEELDRLEAHISEVHHALGKGGPCGRRLDFLMQEFNREANTLSSKSIASSTTANAVELKVLIEQMREQIQNIE